jgi:arylsulfatase A
MKPVFDQIQAGVVKTMTMFFLFLVFAALTSSATAKESVRPNIVLILADDLGWSDLGCYGNRFNETPNIDRLAKQGIRFTDFYAGAPVCSPTRASIISGQHPARVGITAHIPGHWRPFEKLVEPPNALHLPTNTISVAHRLKAAGYATGYFGKWHLGGKGIGPEKFGFDEVFEFTGHSLAPDGKRGKGNEGKRACEHLTDLAVRFMEKNQDEPFFLQLNPSAVHIPLNTTPALQAKYEAKAKVPGYSCHPSYAGLLEEMDTSVGRVVETLNRLGIAENTLIVFTSDNGGLEREMGGWPGTLNRPLRNEKGSLYEGGIRVPFVVAWPRVIKGGSVSETPAISTDIYPTILNAVKIKLPTSLDGTSLLAVLKNPTATVKRDAIYWHYPHYHHSRPSGAIRSGDWKLIEFFDTNELELYNLAQDISEGRDLASDLPEKASALHARLKAWRQEVCAQLPQRNPAYNPERAQEWWNRNKIEPTEAPGTFK